MAQGSRFTSMFVAEAQSGVTPANPIFNIFRATQSGLDINIATLESDEIRDDAEVADFRLGTRSVEGTVQGELSFGTFDLLIAAALRGAWNNNVVIGAIARPSFTFVDYNADITDKPYTIYRGCEINSMTISVSAAAMTTIEFGVVGRTMEQATSLPAGATVNPRTTTSPMDGFSGALREAGQPISVITELSFQIENGIEARFVVGSKYSIRPSSGRRQVTGSMTAYFEDNTLRDKFLNETETSIELELLDPTDPDNKYIIELPRVKITEAPRPIDGEGDIMLNMSYRGLLSASAGHSIQITRELAAAGGGD